MSDNIFEENETASTKDLEALIGLAEEARAIDQVIEELEENIKGLKAQSDEIKMNKMPVIMGDLRISSFSLADGTEIVVNDFVRGNLPKDPEKFEVAKNYLVSIGGGPLIKTEVSMKFGKEEREEAIACMEALEKEGYEPSASEKVHYATLGKFVRELLDAGETIDTGALGVYTGRIAKFKKG